ncbi:MAG TPA: ATP-dependent DNA ligase [Candidatus Binatia bacterium]|nr:ATP-dependent DNA ligase [Candidatus Binatia bacterium]
MRFSELASIYAELERTSSGNKLREILSSFFKRVPKEDIGHVAFLTLGQIAPHYANVNLGVADKMVLRALASATNKSPEFFLKRFKKTGDIGDIAAEFMRGKSTLTIREAFEELHTIAAASGAGSQERKVTRLAKLLKQASPDEARYLCRIALGNLRMGVADKTALDALAIAYTGKKENKKILEAAYNIAPDVSIIAKTLATKGLKAVANIGVTLGTPLLSMLCQRVESLTEIPGLMGTPFAVEVKYDGERIQVHKQGNTITLYSRRLENVTSQFPDIVEHIRKTVRAKSAVLDSEAMPTDPKTGKLLHFQALMSRRRKHDIDAFVKKIPVTLFVFDILYLNGKSLIATPYDARTRLLAKSVKVNARLKLANRVFCTNVDCAEELFNRTVTQGGEGVVLKKIDSPYQAGVRGWNWVKWKPEYVKGMQDTFDLVVVGGFYGAGKRGGMLSSYLCAAYDESKDRFETFTKVATGFSDEQLREMQKKALKFKSAHKSSRLVSLPVMTPDVWFEPGLVIEVLGAEITKSPMHTAAGGLALRFPRFLRYREDKSAEEATTTREIVQMARRKRAHERF